MTDETVARKLDEALEKINGLPEPERGPLLKLLEETRSRHAELQSNFSRIAAALDDWRMALKYLVFDREASHREMAELRRRLGGQEG